MKCVAARHCGAAESVDCRRTGGNINQLFRLSRTKEDKPVTFKQLKVDS